MAKPAQTPAPHSSVSEVLDVVRSIVPADAADHIPTLSVILGSSGADGHAPPTLPEAALEHAPELPEQSVGHVPADHWPFG
jgi:hypothetical protein